MAKNIWKDLDKKEVFSFCDGYIKYLDNSKTERLCESYSKMLSLQKNLFLQLKLILNLMPLLVLLGGQ